jgi:hypothetical protein
VNTTFREASNAFQIFGIQRSRVKRRYRRLLGSVGIVLAREHVRVTQSRAATVGHHYHASDFLDGIYPVHYSSALSNRLLHDAHVAQVSARLRLAPTRRQQDHAG